MVETERLRLTEFGPQDSAFILELLNDPDWKRFIGDRGIRTLEEARGYIERGPMAMYARLGFGLYRVALRESDVPIGMCGLIKRDSLEHVDLGFAFLPAWRGQGYAYESAAAMRDYGVGELGLERIVAITSPDNDTSGKLLLRLGFDDAGMIPWGTEGDTSRYFVFDP